MPGPAPDLRQLCTSALLCLALLGLPMCRKKPAAKKPESKPAAEKVAKKSKRPKDDEDLPPAVTRTPEETAVLLKQIEAFTGGRTKLVWNECLNPRRADPFSFTDGQALKVLDTRDPRGEHQLLDQNDNFSRPLISPDGETILYTRKTYDREHAKWSVKLEVLRTDWSGSPPKVIGEGYALDVWRDPATGKNWVYAATDVPAQEERTFNFQKLVRFPLETPEQVEVLWNESYLSPDNIQLSRDGESMCALLPWPNAGVLRKDGDGWAAHKFTTGCWPSHSPDNSYVFWVFDGGHRSATFFAGDGKTWVVPFNSAPHLKRSEVYHPRWTNHPRYMVLTGPYISKSGPPISKSGRGAQVQLGRFSPKLDKIEEFLQVTQGNLGAGFPVAWIEGGDKATLEGFTKPATTASPHARPKTWPVKPEGVVFVWNDRASLNRFMASQDGKQHHADVEALDAARGGRFNNMDLDGGALRLGGDSASLVSSAWSKPGDAAFEAVLIPQTTPAPAGPLPLLSAPGLDLSVQGQHLVVVNRHGAWQAKTPLPDKPFHLAVSSAAGGPQVWVNGQALDLSPQSGATLTPAENVSFGGGWPGGIMRIALYARALTAEEAAANSLQAQELIAHFPPAALRVKLKGKLVEQSSVPTLEAIEPYTSSWVACVYEVEQVESGELKDKKVLVRHWGLINRHPTTLFPREIGKAYDLTIEKAADHAAQLTGDRVGDDTDAFDLEPWIDVSTPGVR